MNMVEKDLSQCSRCGGKATFVTVHYYDTPIHYLGWLEKNGEVLGYIKRNREIHWLEEQR